MKSLVPPWQEWEAQGAGDSSIQGFATDISANVGERIDFKVDTDATDYTIDIYRTGWYRGLGARKITTVSPSTSLPQIQPECLSDVSTELTDCGTWEVSGSWDVPSDTVSGVYLAKITRADNGDASHITFIVRDESSTSDVLFQTSDPTWHAYNIYGGSDFYSGGDNGRAHKISYNRPFATRAGNRSPRLLLRRRVPSGAIPGAQWLRRQLLLRRRHRQARRLVEEP